MADPLSIASAVVGIVAAGLQLSSALYDICETIGSAQTQVEDIACDLNPLIAVVDELGRTFAAPDGIYSDVLVSSLKDVIEQFQKQFKTINRMIGRTTGLPELQLRAKVAWVFREKKVKEVKAGLDSLKSTLSFILTALTVVKGHRQNNKADRDLLGNMLRSQRRSVKVLRNLETERADEDARLHADSSNSKADQYKSHVRTTAEVLSDVVPLLSRADVRESKYQAPTSTSLPPEYAAGYSSNNFNIRSKQPASSAFKSGVGSAMTSSYDFKAALGDFYPIWKSQILENVDLLLSRWTQNPVELEGSPSNFTKEERRSAASTSGSNDPPSKNQNSTPPPTPTMSAHYRKLQDITDEKSNHLHRLEKERSARNDLENRLQMIQGRLKKREFGWLEIDDKALTRLETEMDDIEKRRVLCDQEIQSISDLVEALTHDYSSTVAAIEKRKEEKRKEEERKTKEEKSFKVNMEPIQIPSLYYQTNKAPDNSSKPKVSLNWLNEEDDFVDSDPEDSSNETKNSTLNASFPTSKDKPNSQHNARSRSPYRKHPLPYPSDSSSETLFPPASDPTTPIPPQSYCSQCYSRDRTGTSSLRSPSPLSPQCQRQAWKPPQPFMDGFNTLSYVLRKSMQHRLWFKASQDAYRFYLGAEPTVFYTIDLIPSDLATYDTSRIEWTAIEKPWAMAKTLHAMQLPFFEDSIGFMWIRKELNWLEIQQIFDNACAILDNSLHTCARQIVQKRSVDPKNLSTFEKPFASLSQVLNEKNALSQSTHDHHRVFFHADDEELMKRSKRSAKLMRSAS